MQKELQDLYSFRDLFFENHPIEMATEKNKRVEEKKEVLIEKFESIDGKKLEKYFIIIVFVGIKLEKFSLTLTY